MRPLAARLCCIAIAATASLGFARLASAADESQHGWLLPNSISDEADKIDHLWWVIFVITTVTFVLTEGALIYFIIKYRARPGQKALYMHGSHKVEVIWTIIPSIILAFIAFTQMDSWLEQKDPKRLPATISSRIDELVAEQTPHAAAVTQALAENPDNYAFEVHVLARQFSWNFRYTGPDRVFGTPDDLVTDELIAPVNKKVVVTMRTLDVIHSLYMPHLRFKQDVVPGLTISGWFKAREEGVYPVACAELCGVQHYTMRTRMRIVSDQDWQKLYAERYQGPIDYTSALQQFRWWPIEIPK
jgi:cytochrome c oxidase subunit II